MDEVHFNFYNKVEYLFDQDLDIRIDEETDELIINHKAADVVLDETVIIDLLDTSYGCQFVRSCDVEVLTNEITSEQSVGWAKKGTAVSNAWRASAAK